MRSISTLGLLATAAALLTACDSAETPPADAATEPSAGAGAAGTDQSAGAANAPPYKPVASVLDLMRGTVTFAAEDYWGSVSIVIDADGVTENQPETDGEWQEVWSAGITLAESGNLLMMPPRAIDDPQWTQYAEDLVDVGLEAAQIAANKDFEGVLEHGEAIYNVCVDCHRTFVPALPDL